MRQCDAAFVVAHGLAKILLGLVQLRRRGGDAAYGHELLRAPWPAQHSLAPLASSARPRKPSPGSVSAERRWIGRAEWAAGGS
jgi:hypothetical protein